MQRFVPQYFRWSTPEVQAPKEQVPPEMEELPMVICVSETSDDDFTERDKSVFEVVTDCTPEDFPEPSHGALITTGNERVLAIFKRTICVAIERFLAKTVPYIPSTQAFAEKAYSLIPSKDTLSDAALSVAYNGVLLTVKVVSTGIELSVQALTVAAQTSDQIGQALGVESQRDGLGLPKAIAQCAKNGALQAADISVEIIQGFGQEVLPVAIKVLKKALEKRQRQLRQH